MAEQLKHTPGPWGASIGFRGARIHIANDFNHPLSFGFQYPETNDELVREGEANAHLIAAAPELLEALEELVELVPESEFVGGKSIDNTRAISGARTAIAKAKGAI